ncbi:MAG: sodium:solute symporter [Spirochaetae bacterium HGW-Spirochaetae-5]|nr:MAG: sodium:solute symporter [Spirochaetae bacterium HGW-Spirochaetae-5]
MNFLLITIVTLIFLIITAFFGYLGYRHTKDTTDFLLAGRKTHPVVMAVSYGSTFISTSAIIGFGGAAAVFGMGVLWLTVLNIGVGIFIAFVVFGKRTRRMGHNLDAHTFPELIGKRFDSSLLQTASGLMIFIAMPLYAGSVIIGGAQFIAQTLSVSYEAALFFFVAVVAVYVIMGGLKGVLYTDAFQGSIMFVGMILLIVMTYWKLGGVVDAHRALSNIAPEAVKIWGPMGHQGWTSMPLTGSVFWWQLVSTIVLGVGIGVLAQPQLAVRFMTVKSDRELNRGVLVGGVFILMMTGVAFVVGSLSNVYFLNNPSFGKIAILAAEKKVDNIIPLFINTAMPPWFTAVFMVTLLAAAMSTLSSQFHTMGSAFGRDFLEQGMKVKTKSTIRTIKLSMGAGIIISTLLAFYLPRFFEQGSAIIAIGTAIFFGLCAATFLPLYFGGLFFKRITKAGAISGFFTGLTAAAFWILFVHAKESAPLGLCKLIFGVPSLAGAASKLQFVDPIVVALPLSMLVTIIVSLMTKPPTEEHLAKCFK